MGVMKDANNKNSSIVIRKLNPNFDAEIPRYYAYDSPHLSHLLNALSLLFPAGEDGFVKSVKRYKNQIKDPILTRDIRLFTGQELLHSSIHASYNRWLIETTPKSQKFAEHVNKHISKNDDAILRRFPRFALAKTVALEHMTSTLAACLLQDEHMVNSIHKEPRKVWIWHAIEEIEHRSVAFDVYQKTVNSYWLKVLAFLFATFAVTMHCIVFTTAFVAIDKQLSNLESLFKSMNVLVGRNGYFIRVIKVYFRFLKPNFHPSQEPYEALITKWENELISLDDLSINGKFFDHRTA